VAADLLQPDDVAAVVVQALIYLGMSHLMLRKLTRSSAPSSPAG
jgi:hypothetical protein